MHQKLFKSYPSCWLINCEADTDDDIISAHVKGQSCYRSCWSLCFMLRHRWRPIEQRFIHFFYKSIISLAEVFLMHAFCKTIFCVQIDVTNITLPCFLFRNDAERPWLSGSAGCPLFKGWILVVKSDFIAHIYQTTSNLVLQLFQLYPRSISTRIKTLKKLKK